MHGHSYNFFLYFYDLRYYHYSTLLSIYLILYFVFYLSHFKHYVSGWREYHIVNLSLTHWFYHILWCWYNLPVKNTTWPIVPYFFLLLLLSFLYILINFLILLLKKFKQFSFLLSLIDNIKLLVLKVLANVKFTLNLLYTGYHWFVLIFLNPDNFNKLLLCFGSNNSLTAWSKKPAHFLLLLHAILSSLFPSI
jgi:hypothetical protein